MDGAIVGCGLSRCLPHDLVAVPVGFLTPAEFLRQVTFIQVRNFILSLVNDAWSHSFYTYCTSPYVHIEAPRSTVPPHVFLVPWEMLPPMFSAG
jgi:hypothetical protein